LRVKYPGSSDIHINLRGFTKNTKGLAIQALKHLYLIKLFFSGGEL